MTSSGMRTLSFASVLESFKAAISFEQTIASGCYCANLTPQGSLHSARVCPLIFQAANQALFSPYPNYSKLVTDNAFRNSSGVIDRFGMKRSVFGLPGRSVNALSSNSPQTPRTFAHTKNAGLSVERVIWCTIFGESTR